jgi:hypothetical protein
VKSFNRVTAERQMFHYEIVGGLAALLIPTVPLNVPSSPVLATQWQAIKLRVSLAHSSVIYQENR